MAKALMPVDTNRIGVGLRDGNVRFITADMANDTWCWACNPQDSNADPSDW